MSHGMREHDVLAFTGSRSDIWHRMGNQIEEGLSAREGFEQNGLMWETELAPIYAELRVGGTDDEPELVRVPLADHQAHIRLDTREGLGVVSKGYREVTNKQLAEFVDALVKPQPGAGLASAGSLYNGRRVYCCVKLPKVIQVGADITETYLIVSNGHGGFASLYTYPTSMRPICANTLSWSERDLSKGVRFRHSGDMGDKIQQAKVAMGLAIKETERFEEQVKALANKDLTPELARVLLANIYDATFGKLPNADEQPEAFSKLRAKRTDVLTRWEANLEDERQQVAGIQGTAWAALNAVTQWHDHERGRYKSVYESGARFHSNMFGTSRRDKGKALKTALELVK